MAKSFWFFLEGHRFKYVTLSILNVVSYGNNIIMPFMVGLIINFFTDYSPGDDLYLFYLYCGILASSYIFLSITRLFAKRRLSQIGIEMRHRARVEGFQRLMGFSLRWHDNESSGNKVEKINRGARSLIGTSRILKDRLSSIIIVFVGVIGVFAVLNLYFLLFFAIYVLLFLLVVTYYNRRLSDLTYEQNKAKERASGRYFEGASNILSVKSLGAQKSLVNVVEKAEGDFRKYSMLMKDNNNMRMRAIQVLNGFAIGSYFLLIGNGVINGSLTVGFIATAFSYFGGMMNSMFGFTDILPKLIQERSAISRMMPIFKTKEDKYFGEGNFPRNWRFISFENVSFNYADKSTLRSLNFSINKGEKIGVVGDSGSGKSTFGRILLGLYKIREGRIMVGKRNFYDISHNQILSKITPVIQETELFNMTLKANLTLFKRVSSKTLERAIEISQLQPIIDNLPEGLDTLIGEKGYKLSGGERQRVGIARAICKNPEILLLDEATSALDSATEMKIQKGIESLRDKTILIIAHRLSTLENVDRIVVFDKGKIVETGKFRDLVKDKKSRFYKLWMRQKKNN